MEQSDSIIRHSGERGYKGETLSQALRRHHEQLRAGHEDPSAAADEPKANPRPNGSPSSRRTRPTPSSAVADQRALQFAREWKSSGVWHFRILKFRSA